MIYYAGIGSRKISVEEELYISDLGKKFSKMGFFLYSGHADGADMAFEKASDPELSVIWLPWKDFNGKINSNTGIVVGDREEAKESLKYHPNPKSLSKGGRALMGRNRFQVLGDPPLYPMVDFIVCCADEFNGKLLGGTSQAIRIANKYNIPYFNIRYLENRSKLDNYISIISL